MSSPSIILSKGLGALDLHSGPGNVSSIAGRYAESDTYSFGDQTPRYSHQPTPNTKHFVNSDTSLYYAGSDTSPYGDATPRFTRELTPFTRENTPFGNMTPIPYGTGAMTPNPFGNNDSTLLAARMNALGIEKSNEVKIFVLRVTCVMASVSPGELITRYMLVKLPAHADPERLSGAIAKVHQSILQNFNPPNSGMQKESFSLLINHTRSECDLDFLLQALWHNLPVLPSVDIPGQATKAYDSYFRFVVNDEVSLRDLLPSGSAFECDIEVEYRGETADHGSRFFTMTDLRMGDSFRRLTEDMMDKDFRMKLAVRFGGATVSFWLDGRKVADWEPVDSLFIPDGRKRLLQCVVHPNENLLTGA